MRNKITGAIGLALGIFICLPAFMSSVSMADPANVPWAGVLLIGLGIYYLFFKKPPADNSPDIAPEDRFKNSDE